MNGDRDRFCHHCGEPLGLPGYPKTCTKCGTMIWSNPLPVAVCVQPVLAPSGHVGLAMARRAIEPKLGSWCLLGGHLEHDESFEDGARREFIEETMMMVHPGDNMRLTHSYTNGRGHVLVAVEFDPISQEDWEQAKLCPENSEFGVMWSVDAVELGFPIHEWIAREWWHRLLNPSGTNRG